MSNKKIKLVAKFKEPPTFSELCDVVDPKRLIAKSPNQYKYWFSLPEDCKSAEAAIVKAYPDVQCEVIGEGDGVQAETTKKKTKKVKAE